MCPSCMPHNSKNIEASCEKRVAAGAVSLYDKVLCFLCILFVFVCFLETLQTKLASTLG